MTEKLSEVSKSNFKTAIKEKISKIKEDWETKRLDFFSYSISQLIHNIGQLSYSKEEKLDLFDIYQTEFDLLHKEYIDGWDKVKDTKDEDAQSAIWPMLVQCNQIAESNKHWRRNIEFPEIKAEQDQKMLDFLGLNA